MVDITHNVRIIYCMDDGMLSAVTEEIDMGMKTWRVRVHTKDGVIELGQVHEQSEKLARCAALSKYGISPDDDNDHSRKGIREDDEFDVGEV